MKKIIFPTMLAVIVLVFFWKFFAQGLVPVPADTLVGLYHPFRDVYATEYPNGIPFKNYLITDPIRQQYPWRQLALDSFTQGEMPLWNPYSFSGYPLHANLQSAVLYPLNIVFLAFSFIISWSLLIILQPLLAGLFMFMYLKKLKLENISSLFGGIIYAFSGFSISWLTWNTIGHVALWLPVLLYLIERIIEKSAAGKNIIGETVLLILTFAVSFFAGHLQVFAYLTALTVGYSVFRSFSLSSKRRKKPIIIALSGFVIAFIILAVQWVPTLLLINNSSRSIDLQTAASQEGWYIPLRHLVQFAAPDYFGNPATLNYWGAWNYGELVGYVGIIPLLFSFIAIYIVKNKYIRFFTIVIIFSLLLSLDTFFARIVSYIPIINSSQPTRLIFLIDFSLAVLASFGLNALIINKITLRKTIVPISLLLIVFGILWLLSFGLFNILDNWTDLETLDIYSISRRNLALPTALFAIGAGVMVLALLIKDKIKFSYLLSITAIVLLLFTIFDLYRFGWKFTPFVQADYVYPESTTLTYLQNQDEVFRIMSTDDRILPPNVSAMYEIQSAEGYDPLYVSDYAELASAWVRGKPDISPLSFNRIISPQDYKSPIANLVNIRYVLTFDEISDEGFELVHKEGLTKLYKNNNALSRAYFAESILFAESKQEAIDYIFEKDTSEQYAIVYEEINIPTDVNENSDNVSIEKYSANNIVISTKSDADRFLVLSDVYYPTWRAFVDGNETIIYRTNYAFRGIIVPSGSHVVTFENSLW